MSAARFIVADVFDGLAQIPDGTIDLCVTSPPFLALRSYLPADHPDKAQEIGSEATPAAFIDRLLDVVEAVTPKLTEWGSICIELGDTYSGSGGAGGDYDEGGLRDGQERFNGAAAKARAHATKERTRNPPDDWPLAKSLCLIPESFRWALVYGRNPFNGRTTPRWRARNVIRWCRPNPPVGALGDKFRPGTSEMVVACKSAKRYFDLDAVREPHKEGPTSEATAISRRRALNRDAPGNHTEDALTGITSNPAGAPPLDWWEIPTEPPILPGMPEPPAKPEPSSNPGTHRRTAKGVDSVERSGKSADRGGNWASLRELGETAGAPPLDWWEIPTEPLPGFDPPPEREPPRRGSGSTTFHPADARDARDDRRGHPNTGSHPAGAPPLDYWVIPTEAYSGSHYATFPRKLLDKPILSMCPERVCVVCGEPSRRIIETTNAVGKAVQRTAHRLSPDGAGDGRVGVMDVNDAPDYSERVTLGWSDCGCPGDHWRRGMVLDPFAGSGTSLQVALAHGRDAIGIDLDARNAELAIERCGLFLEIVESLPADFGGMVPHIDVATGGEIL